ncbi:hypothetical protein C1H46_014400 [Malus baccata]|uniref:Uncharacterized protein n=1 Tax=Malus baccata TaxID=106549 RepID=A0A540MMN9_MALBA|nr:hypothetical protein C1H46_014400 [Malus baccata]
MAAPPNLRPLFRTRYQIRFCLYGNMDCSGYVGEDGGEKYNWERYAESSLNGRRNSNTYQAGGTIVLSDDGRYFSKDAVEFQD